jgi:glycosyltransferase involved in cell wall biosynthesis
VREAENAVKPMPSSPARDALTVLQVIPSLDTGGAERATIDIAAALADRGDRALVASGGGRLETELTEAGGTLVRLPTESKNPLTMALNARRLAQLIRRERVDIVHARSRAPAWSARIACRVTGAPFVTTYHGIYGEKGKAKRLYNSVMAAGDIVIANSEYTARLIRERYATPAERIVVIPRGIDLAAFNTNAVDEARREALQSGWRIPPGARVILQLARLSGWKGQEVLIQALALPPLAGRGELVAILAGDAQGRDHYRRELEALTEVHGFSERVRIVGHCDDTPAAFALADVAVVASTEAEAFGRAAVEAAAMGVPVVATALGATEETVLAPPRVADAARTGWLVPPGDAGALAAAIDAALALSAEERRALGGRARRRAEEFATATMQARTLALYDRLHTERAESVSKR